MAVVGSTGLRALSADLQASMSHVRPRAHSLLTVALLTKVQCSRNNSRVRTRAPLLLFLPHSVVRSGTAFWCVEGQTRVETKELGGRAGAEDRQERVAGPLRGPCKNTLLKIPYRSLRSDVDRHMSGARGRRYGSVPADRNWLIQTHAGWLSHLPWPLCA